MSQRPMRQSIKISAGSRGNNASSSMISSGTNAEKLLQMAREDTGPTDEPTPLKVFQLLQQYLTGEEGAADQAHISNIQWNKQPWEIALQVIQTFKNEKLANYYYRCGFFVVNRCIRKLTAAEVIIAPKKARGRKGSKSSDEQEDASGSGEANDGGGEGRCTVLPGCAGTMQLWIIHLLSIVGS